MALTKQQKWDMIYDVELRLAKEELAEQYVKDLDAIENSKKPLRTLKDIAQKDTSPVVNIEQENIIAGKALSEYQRDEWYNLNEHHFNELKAISLNVDSQELVVEQQEELKQLLARHGRDRDRIEQSETPLEEEQAILYSYENIPDPELMARLRQKMDHQTSEEKELLEQSEIAAKTPFKKDGLDSKTQWEFIGFESLVMRESIPKEKNRSGVTEEQMQAFREEHYGGRHDALETLRQHSQENGHVTEEQLNQFTIDSVESQLRAQDILRGTEGREVDFDLQEHFENAQNMSNDQDMGMEL